MDKQKNIINKIMICILCILCIPLVSAGWYNSTIINITAANDTITTTSDITMNGSQIWGLDSGESIVYRLDPDHTAVEYVNFTKKWDIDNPRALYVENVAGGHNLVIVDYNATRGAIDNNFNQLVFINKSFENYSSIKLSSTYLGDTGIRSINKIGSFFYYDVGEKYYRSTLTGGSITFIADMQNVGSIDTTGHSCSNGTDMYFVNIGRLAVEKRTTEGQFVNDFLNWTDYISPAYTEIDCVFNGTKVLLLDRGGDDQITEFDLDKIIPTITNNMSNQTGVEAGDSVSFGANATDVETGLMTAWLYTNETGYWIKHTDGMYGSPKNLSHLSRHETHFANFTFINCLVGTTYENKTVGWMINFSDRSGNYQNTSKQTQTFMPLVVTTDSTDLTVSNSTCRNRNNFTIFFDGNGTNIDISIQSQMYQYNKTYRSCPYKSNLGDKTRLLNLSGETNTSIPTLEDVVGYCNTSITDVDILEGELLRLQFDQSISQKEPADVPSAVASTIFGLLLIITTIIIRRTSED